MHFIIYNEEFDQKRYTKSKYKRQQEAQPNHTSKSRLTNLLYRRIHQKSNF